MRSKILIGAVILVEIVLIITGVSYRQNFNRDFELVSGRDFSGSTVLEILLKNPSFPTSFEGFEVLGFQVASTGRVYKIRLKDSGSGNVLGEAEILETVGRDRGDPNNLIRLPLIVQFTPSGSPDRNIMPWVLEKAAELRSVSGPDNSQVFSEDLIKEIFPRGTIWSFIPLINSGGEELDQLVEYSHYAQKYYGGTTYPQLEELFRESPDRHALLGEVSKPIFLLGVFELPLEE